MAQHPKARALWGRMSGNDPEQGWAPLPSSDALDKDLLREVAHQTVLDTLPGRTAGLGKDHPAKDPGLARSMAVGAWDNTPFPDSAIAGVRAIGDKLGARGSVNAAQPYRSLQESRLSDIATERDEAANFHPYGTLVGNVAPWFTPLPRFLGIGKTAPGVVYAGGIAPAAKADPDWLGKMKRFSEEVPNAYMVDAGTRIADKEAAKQAAKEAVKNAGSMTAPRAASAALAQPGVAENGLQLAREVAAEASRMGMLKEAEDIGHLVRRGARSAAVDAAKSGGLENPKDVEGYAVRHGAQAGVHHAHRLAQEAEQAAAKGIVTLEKNLVKNPKVLGTLGTAGAVGSVLEASHLLREGHPKKGGILDTVKSSVVDPAISGVEGFLSRLSRPIDTTASDAYLAGKAKEKEIQDIAKATDRVDFPRRRDPNGTLRAAPWSDDLVSRATSGLSSLLSGPGSYRKLESESPPVASGAGIPDTKAWLQEKLGQIREGIGTSGYSPLLHSLTDANPADLSVPAQNRGLAPRREAAHASFDRGTFGDDVAPREPSLGDRIASWFSDEGRRPMGPPPVVQWQRDREMEAMDRGAFPEANVVADTGFIGASDARRPGAKENITREEYLARQGQPEKQGVLDQLVEAFLKSKVKGPPGRATSASMGK